MAGGLVLSLLIGASIGQSDLLAIAAFGLAADIGFVLTLQDRIWTLIPIFWYVTGRLGFLPVPLNLREIAVCLAGAVFIIFLALRSHSSRKDGIHRLDRVFEYWISGYGVYSQPGGLSAMGSALVGGRPYFDLLIGFVAFEVLSRMTLRPGLAKVLPLFSCAAQAGISMLGALAHYLPATAPLIERIYSGVDVSEYARQVTGSEESDINRVTDLLAGSEAGILTLVSYFPPLGSGSLN